MQESKEVVQIPKAGETFLRLEQARTHLLTRSPIDSLKRSSRLLSATRIAPPVAAQPERSSIDQILRFQQIGSACSSGTFL